MLPIGKSSIYTDSLPAKQSKLRANLMDVEPAFVSAQRVRMYWVWLWGQCVQPCMLPVAAAYIKLCKSGVYTPCVLR